MEKKPRTRAGRENISVVVSTADMQTLQEFYSTSIKSEIVRYALSRLVQEVRQGRVEPFVSPTRV